MASKFSKKEVDLTKVKFSNNQDNQIEKSTCDIMEWIVIHVSFFYLLKFKKQFS